jgi:AraC family transcriptional regulator of adaptative response / DNA-3-methyladenine glycosylase II
MTIDGDAAYQVLLAHDARFDGRLFVGVTSTGVYCRPICRVRMPARRNCRFFASPAQAEAASFVRASSAAPRSRPAPALAWSVMDASRTLARQAASALDEFAADGEAPSVARIAARLGVSDPPPAPHLLRRARRDAAAIPADAPAAARQAAPHRHSHAGRADRADERLSQPAPLQRRVPRRLSHEPDAAAPRHAARAFGAAPTTRAQRAAAPVDGAEAITVTLGYRAPYDVDALVAFIAQRAIAGVEATSAASIRRSVRAGVVGAAPGWLEVRFSSDAARVRLSFAPELGPASGAVIAAVRRWLDLDAAPETIAETLVGLPGNAGLRLPGSVDAVRARRPRRPRPAGDGRRGADARAPPRRALRRRHRDAVA